jgi:hypothetical protein
MGADAVEAVNGTATSAPVSDAELLAELASLGNAEKVAEKVEPEVEAASETSTEEQSDEAEQVEASAAETTEDDETSEDEVDDPKTAKGLDQVRRAEQRWRAEQAKEREAFEKERASHADDIKLAREMKAMRDRKDLVGLARSMKLSDADFKELSIALFAETEDGRKDPRYSAKVAQSARERAQAEELAELRKRLDERDSKEREATERAEAEKQVTRYVDGIAKAATPKAAPIAASLLTKRPEKTRRDLLRVAGDLFRETGDQPTPAQVLKAYESELRELGITAPQVAATKAAPTKGATTAGAKPATAANVRVTDDELLRELQSGKFS